MPSEPVASLEGIISSLPQLLTCAYCVAALLHCSLQTVRTKTTAEMHFVATLGLAKSLQSLLSLKHRHIRFSCTTAIVASALGTVCAPPLQFPDERQRKAVRHRHRERLRAR